MNDVANIGMRKSVLLKEMVYSEAGRESGRPLTRAVGVAVVHNPLAGRHEEDLSALSELGARVAELLMPDLVGSLPAAARGYGKAAMVGLDGDPEHGAAVVHPRMGQPMRAAIGGGKNLIPSNVKMAYAGASIDVPLAHKDETWSFDDLDTVTVSLADAPRPREICVILAISDGPRLNARIGSGPLGS